MKWSKKSEVMTSSSIISGIILPPCKELQNANKNNRNENHADEDHDESTAMSDSDDSDSMEEMAARAIASVQINDQAATGTSTDAVDAVDDVPDCTDGDSIEVRIMEVFDAPAPSSKVLPILGRHAYPCDDSISALPPSPTCWPQRPLLLKPSPDSNTRIRGIRQSSEKEYGPLPNADYCTACTLPINNGTEGDGGRAWVIDFETDLFVGTAMLRIKNAPPPFPTLSTSHSSSSKDTTAASYFDGKKRTFQAVVRGKFTRPGIPMSECVTGQYFSRPAGKLPPRLLLRGAVRLIATLAPQLQADFDGDRPRFLSPLVSTAQSVLVQEEENEKKQNQQSENELGKGVMVSVDTTSKNISGSWTSSSSDSKPIITEEQLSVLSDMDQKNDDDKSLSWRIANYKLYSGADDEIESSSLTEPPSSHETSIMNALKSSSKSSLSSSLRRSCPMEKSGGGCGNTKSRIKTRKKTFDRLFASKSKEPTFDPNSVYTFEFYQHLLLFHQQDDMVVDMGRAIGKHGLKSMLDGQPLKFMAAHQSSDDGEMNWLWNFDIWHEGLYDAAKQHHDAAKQHYDAA